MLPIPATNDAGDNKSPKSPPPERMSDLFLFEAKSQHRGEIAPLTWADDNKDRMTTAHSWPTETIQTTRAIRTRVRRLEEPQRCEAVARAGIACEVPELRCALDAIPVSAHIRAIGTACR